MVAGIRGQDFAYTNINNAITITAYSGPGGNVDIPGSIDGLPVTSLGDWAFFQNPFFILTNAVTGVAIPNSVTNIGNYAFYDCLNLTNVTIGKGVINIGTEVFKGCFRLGTIALNPLNTAYSVADGVLFNKNKTALIQYPVGSPTESYTIPSGVTNIGEYSFFESSLTNVRIPGSVLSIGFEAFGYSANLMNVFISQGVADIGAGAFNGCESLSSVTIPDSITNIGADAFWDCRLGSVVIPARVASIGSGAFYQCFELTNLTILNGVTNIGDSAFYECAGLTSVVIPGSVTKIGRNAFNGCTSLAAVYFKGNPPDADNTVFDAVGSTVFYLPGTTGWGSTLGGAATVLWNPLMQTSDGSFGVKMRQFGFNVTGTAGIPLVIEANTNLTSGAAWVSLLTNGSIYFSDPHWTNYPSRFYRIRSP
jgi:hypothetical protein